MTTTYPRRTATRYRGAIYGIDVIDHDTGLVVKADYRGKTRQRGRLRENQHRDRQPFSDRIVGDAYVLWEGLCTDEELAEMERQWIQDAEVRPRLNVEMNEDNPHRIPKWKQVEQRHERDRAARRPLWVPYEQRSRESLLEWDARTPIATARTSWSPRAQKVALWSAGWLLTTVVTAGLLFRHTTVNVWWGLGLGALASALLMVWGVLRTPDSWRMWRRRLRKARRSVRRWFK